MEIFALNKDVTSGYRGFLRSFATTRASDMQSAVKHTYGSGRLTLEPLVSMTPRYAEDGSIADRVADGTLNAHTAAIFYPSDGPIVLHRHQDYALSRAKRSQCESEKIALKLKPRMRNLHKCAGPLFRRLLRL